MKKKLPKAVTRTADDIRRAGATEKMVQTADSPSSTDIQGRPAVLESSRMIQHIEAAGLLNVGANAQASGAPVVDRTERLSRANTIVERHANFSVLGGAIPLPLINVAGVTIIVLRMIKLLCRLYGIQYEHGRARAVAVGLAAGAVPTTASAVTTSTLVYLIPGVNLLGLAVSSATASICARAVGRRFVDHFETGGTLMDFPVVDRR